METKTTGQMFRKKKRGNEMNDPYDVVVAGVGSGGFGAALSAARRGLRVLAIERAPELGGTSVRSGVSIWEKGCGCTGIPFDLYRRLKTIPGTVGVCTMARHCCWPEDGYYPGGESLIDPALGYADTLVRAADGDFDWKTQKSEMRSLLHEILFEPAAMAKTMEDMLVETGRVTLLKKTAVTAVEAGGGRIRSITLSTKETIRAPFFIDATADGMLCSASGCEMMLGQEARERFSEPAAPDMATGRINGVSLIFRVSPGGNGDFEPLPEGIPTACWWRPSFPVAAVFRYPNGDLNIDMLPTMEGVEFLSLGPEKTYEECERRIRAAWHWYQEALPEFRRFRISWIAPELAVRETQRVLAEYVLTQHDLAVGLAGQTHPDIIAIADHPMDTHGSHGRGGNVVTSAYGIPYRCLIPKGMHNLLVACRAAGFSSLAASSCRLSRTMMQLGQAAGTAVALARELGVDAPGVPHERLCCELRKQHVALEHPLSPELKAYIAAGG